MRTDRNEIKVINHITRAREIQVLGSSYQKIPYEVTRTQQFAYTREQLAPVSSRRF